MCGIAGELDLSMEETLSGDISARMSLAIKHRGQSDYGYFNNGHISIHFNRLAIMDQSSGQQPFWSADKKVVVFCNGEIFNHLELKKLIGMNEEDFESSSDCAVLPFLYQRYGIEFVKKLNGQFAIALYDLSLKKLFLVRDHFGISPMHFAKRGHTFIFSSEIKGILAHPLVKAEINLKGLDQVFTFPGSVSPETIFKDVFSIESGHYLEIQKTIVKKKYWDLNFMKKESQVSVSRPEALLKVEELLKKSIQRRLMAHIPVGLYLSGGLDSSLISAMTRELKTGDLSSFSVTFKDDLHDESRYQDMMVKKLSLTHYALAFEAKDTIQRLRDAVFHSEVALKESYNGCSLALSEMAKSVGISVILSGEGADELFGGYVGHRFDNSLNNMDFNDPLGAALEEEIRMRLWGDKDFFYEKNYYEHSELRQSLYSDKLKEKFREFNCTNESLFDHEALKERSSYHKRAYLDFKLRLSDHLVSDHGDRMSMANTVETRYPFLDIDLVNYVATLPSEIFSGKTEKAFLKEIAKKYLPEEIIKREKFGFRAQGCPYFLKQNVKWINDLLSTEHIKSQGYFNPEAVERLKKNYTRSGFRLNVPYEDDLLMIILTFNILCEAYSIPGIH